MEVVGKEFNRIIAGKKRADADDRGDVLGDFINKNIQNMLVVHDHKVKVTPRGPLYIRAEVDSSNIYISTSALKQYLHEIKLGIKDFEKRLSDSGVLLGKIRKQMASGWNDAVGSTNVQAYMIQSDISHLFPKEIIADEQKAD
jgi:hypothetical protein